jgi:TolB protein
MGKFFSFGISICVAVLVSCCVVGSVQAQTDIHITGAQAGFPVAVPQLCDGGGAGEVVSKIPTLVAKDLQISGLFKVLNPATFVETPGKCGGPTSVAYSDWSVIGAEGLVRGEVVNSNGMVRAEIYLHDIQQQRTVIGKRYEAAPDESAKIAHRFANEIIGYFTGEKGVFGTRIVYVSRVGRFKELFIMDLDGSNVRQLTRDKGLALSPAWSPRGDRIVYTSYRTRTPELYIMSPDGGGARQITKTEGLEIGAKFLPDGGSLITSATIGGVSKIVRMDLSGRIIKQLTSGSSIDVSPSLSPDGSQVAYCSNRLGDPQIFVMSSSGGESKRISFAESSYCTSPAWSPRGDKIAFVCRQGTFQLFVTSPQGGAAAQLTFAGNNEDPSWSPDGRFIAFSSSFGLGGAKNIGVLSLLGGSPTRITFAQSEDSQPAWSPIVE